MHFLIWSSFTFFFTAEFCENVSAKLRMKIMSIDIFSYGPHFTSGLSKLTIFYKLNLPPVSCLLCLVSCCPLAPTLRPMRARPVPGLNQSESWIADPLTQGVWRGFSRWIAPSESGHRIRRKILSHITLRVTVTKTRQSTSNFYQQEQQ